MATEAYHAVVIARFNGRKQNRFLIKALAPPSQRYPEYNNSFLTKCHSRQFGRHWKDIGKMMISQKKVPNKNRHFFIFFDWTCII